MNINSLTKDMTDVWIVCQTEMRWENKTPEIGLHGAAILLQCDRLAPDTSDKTFTDDETEHLFDGVASCPNKDTQNFCSRLRTHIFSKLVWPLYEMWQKSWS